MTPAAALPDAAPWTPSSDDLSLEAGIRAAHDAVLGAGTPESQRAAYKSMQELCARRSPEMIAHLEQQRGLRP